jgi:RimJ/RimL family protein N-acetyltransferase
VIEALETRRLLLRPLQAADIPSLVALWSDTEVTRYLGGPRDPAHVQEVLERDLRDMATAEPSPYGFMAVLEKTTGRLVGDCGLTEKDVDGRREVEVVYVFAVDAWGQGYATEAASALRDYAVDRRGLRRLIALIDPENIPSARVAAKIGMRFERATVRPDGSVRHVFALAPAAGPGLPQGLSRGRETYQGRNETDLGRA